MTGSTPAPPQIAPDPLFTELAAQATKDQNAALQTQTQGDMASLMARYGTRLAMAGTQGTSPLMQATPVQMPTGLFGQMASRGRPFGG